jgi:hypothetical protein
MHNHPKEREETRTREEKRREGVGRHKAGALGGGGFNRNRAIPLGFQPSRHIVCLLGLGAACPTKTAQTEHLVGWSTRTSNRLINHEFTISIQLIR